MVFADSMPFELHRACMGSIVILPVPVSGKPLTKAIELFGKWLSANSEPELIVRRAKAEAAAKLIHAENDAQISLRVRAIERNAEIEMRQQANLDAIACKALPLIGDSPSSEPVDPDWRMRFLSCAQDVSNEHMQTVWAKIAAGEANRPKSFSLRTLSVVRDLQAADALLFTRLCTYVWHEIDGDPSIIHVPERRPTGPESPALTYDESTHLASIGLITSIDHGLFSPGLAMDFRKQEWADGLSTVQFRYFDRQASIQLRAEKPDLSIGSSSLTQVGKELSALAGASPDYEYFGSVIKRWNTEGHLAVEI